MGRRAVFLDKDGTLVKDVPYNVDPQRIELAPEAPSALRMLRDFGFELIVVTNQPGVALGYFPVTAMAEVERRLAELLADSDIRLSGFYYCPHHPQAGQLGHGSACDCRKPAPGLLLRAAADHRLDLKSSWLVGDILDDVEAGRRAGCRTVLVDRGGETEWKRSPSRDPDYIAGDLLEAAACIVEAAQCSAVGASFET
ncbi:MAG TPA: HAD family hydrolase [Pirellulales bacterium]|nr:HAD family hydrolase [Pirellulales bacterium]